MKVKLLFLSLIICNTVSAIMSSVEFEAYQLASELLDGKYLVVRIYQVGDNASPGYQTARVRLSSLSFSHRDIKQAVPEIDNSYIIVVSGIDQTDNVISTVLDKYISFETYKDSKMQSIWPETSHKNNISQMVFCDALGNPIPDAKVEVRINLSSGRGRGFSRFSEEPICYDFLDSNGRYESPVWTNATAGLAYILSHPNYGTALVQSRGKGSSNTNSVLIMPLVPLDSESASRSFQGIIVDDNNKPVSSLIVSLNMISNKDGIAYYSKVGGISITDANGYFNIYPPLELNGELYTEPAPENLNYDMFIRPDTSMNLLSYQNTFYQKEFQIGNEPRKIILRRMNPDQYFHTFTFIDEQGEITDPQELAKIMINVLRDNRAGQTLKYEQIKDGCYLNLGKLRAFMMRGNKQFHFSEIDLTEETPEELILITGQKQIYNGTVIDALTGQPVPNVLVLGESGARRDEDYAKLIEQAGELRLRALSEMQNGLSDEQLFESEMRLALTDQQGRYQFIFRRGFSENLKYFNVLDENYHTRRMYLFEADQPEEKDIYNVKTIELLPPPRINQPPIFVFEDEWGNEITDPNILEKISINVTYSESSSKGGNYNSIVPKSMYWDYGTYNANLNYGDMRYTYEPVVINQDSPEVIVFKLKEEGLKNILACGRVVNGITDEPMSGVIVYANEDGLASRGSDNPYECWDILDSMQGDYDLESPVIMELMSALNATTLTITDKNGYYELPVNILDMSRGPTSSYSAVMKDYLGAKQSFDYMVPIEKNSPEPIRHVPYEPDENGSITFPDMRMFPAGQVKLELNLPDMTSDNQNRTRIVFQFRTSPGDTTPWIRKFWETPRDRRGASIIRSNKLRPNGKQSVFLPAGLDLTLIMYTINNQTGGIILRDIKVEQGQTLDLGLIEFPETFKVNVKTIDVLGNPIQNVPVTCLDEFRLYRGQQVKTNSDGIASLYVTPNSKGYFTVACKDKQTDETIRKELIYKINGTEDTGKEFILELSDELLINLFE